jgi:hypothetical protein
MVPYNPAAAAAAMHQQSRQAHLNTGYPYQGGAYPYTAANAHGGGGYEMETGMGFAITHNGAIGFSRDVEDRMMLSAAMGGGAPSTGSGAGYQMQNQQQQQQNQHQKDSNGGGSTSLKSAIKSNRDAFSKMHIVCESAMPENGNDAGVTSTRARTHDGERRAAFSKSSARPMSAARPKVSTRYPPSEDDEEVHQGLSMHDYESDEEELHLGAGSFGMGGFDLDGGEGIMTGVPVKKNGTMGMKQIKDCAKPSKEQIISAQIALKRAFYNAFTQYKSRNAAAARQVEAGMTKKDPVIMNIFTADECAYKLARGKKMNTGSQTGEAMPTTETDRKPAADNIRKLANKAYESWTVDFKPKWEHLSGRDLASWNGNVYVDLQNRIQKQQWGAYQEQDWKNLDTALIKCFKEYETAHTAVMVLTKLWPYFSEYLPKWKPADETYMVKHCMVATKRGKNKQKKKQQQNIVFVQQRPPAPVQYVLGPHAHNQQMKKNASPLHIHYHGPHVKGPGKKHVLLDHEHRTPMVQEVESRMQEGWSDDPVHTGVRTSVQPESDDENHDGMYCQCEFPQPVDVTNTGAHLIYPRVKQNGSKPGNGKRSNDAHKARFGKRSQPGHLGAPAQPMMYAPIAAATGAHQAFQQPMMYIPATSAPMQGMVPVQYMYQ